MLYYIPGEQNHHSYENSLDALLMIKNNAKLLIMSGMKSPLSECNSFGYGIRSGLLKWEDI